MTTLSAAATVPGIRRATLDDADVCGQICYDAFVTINRAHNFPPELPAPEFSQNLLRIFFSHAGFYCVVAEVGGRIVGSNCIDERSTIAGIGPLTVDPVVQNGRIGRTLMQAVVDRARERGFPGVRLLQSAFHSRSLGLYTKMGFDSREPMSVMHGPPVGEPMAGYDVRSATDADVDACNRICARVHGHDRAGELRDSMAHGSVVVVERAGRITGYATAFGYGGHAVAESNADLEALIAAAPELSPPGIIVPTRNGELMRWCLNHGLRIVQPMTLMSRGLYSEPAGAYMPSILY